MEIEVGGVSLDLFGDEDVSVDYTIFPISDVTGRTVSYTNEFSIPRTDRNVALIDPIVNAASKFTCRIFGDNIEMNGIMYVEDSDINRIGETYTVSIVDGMIDKLNLLDDGIENIVDNTTDAFLWEFVDRADADVYDGGLDQTITCKGYAPNDPVNDKFFMITGNFNGTKYDEYESNYPVYPAKLNDDNTQMLWGFRFDKFVNMCMDYAGLDFSTIGEYDRITNDIKYSDLSLNINAPFIGMRNRTVDFFVDEYFEQNVVSQDSLRQLEDALANYDDFKAPMISKGDTTYDGYITFAFIASLKMKMLKNALDEYPDDYIEFNSFTCKPTLVMYKSGTDVFRYAHDPITLTGWLRATDGSYNYSRTETTVCSVRTEDIEEFDIYAADDITFDIEFEIFGRVERFYDGYVGHSIMEDFSGSYKYDDYIFDEENMFILETKGTQTAPLLMAGDQYARPHLNWVSSQNPAIERAGKLDTDNDANTDYIFPEESLAESEYTMSELINDMINRFGLGVWEDDEEVLHIGRIYDRYKETLDLSSKILEEEMTVIYSRDIDNTFAYTNKKVDNLNNMINDDNNMLGDILEYEVNEAGEVNEEVTLTSYPAYKDFYGDVKESGIDQANLVERGIEYWGGSYNEQIDRSTRGISHGFYKLNTENILQGGVHFYTLTVDVEGDSPDFWVDYTRRGTKSIDIYDNSLQYPEMFAEDETMSILAGDGDGVALNNDLLDNFGIVDSETRFKEVYSLPIFLTNDEIKTIRRGAKIIAGDNEYVPISIKGVSFDDEGSYVTLEMVSGSIFKTLGDFNSDFNNDFLIE